MNNEENQHVKKLALKNSDQQYISTAPQIFEYGIIVNKQITVILVKMFIG